MGKPSDQLKVLILGASFGTRNMGVAALTSGAVGCVARRWPEATVSLLDYGKQGGMHNIRVHGTDLLVKVVNIRFSRRLYLSNNIALLLLLAALARLAPFKGLKRGVIAGNRTLSELDSADLAASIAGGDSFSDIYGLGRFFYVALPQLLVIIMGKPLVQLPQTFGPFSASASKALARFILGNSTLIFSRDEEGIRAVRELLGPKAGTKVSFCHDVAFALEAVKPEGFTVKGTAFERAGRTRPTVGLNVSGLLYMGGYTGGNMFGLKLDYRLLVGEMIEMLITRKRAKVVLIPHVFGGPEHQESDLEACRKVYDSLRGAYSGSLSLVDGSYDQHGIKHIIGLCDFFIGSRMHACIAAMSQGVPAVAVAYSGKFKGVMDSVGAGSCVADPCALDCEGVLGVIDRAFEDRDDMARALKERMPAIKESVHALLSQVEA